jgi:hypothetical protein
MEPRGTLLGQGCTRACYADGPWVIKVPLMTSVDFWIERDPVGRLYSKRGLGNELGFQDNRREADLSREFRDRPDSNGVRYARCRLLPCGWLVMERVRMLERSQLPWWALAVEGAQVGRARDGRIVAYDFG